MTKPLRIGVNALYLIPGGVGGTEIYLRNLLQALSLIDTENRYFVFTNRETGAGLCPAAPNFTHVPQPVRAANRPLRILWEQTGLPLRAARLGLDVLLNPGFTAPLYCPCPMVTVFHDLQHKRHPEYFRWFDLPFWQALLFASAHLSRMLLADSEATRDDLLRFYRLPESKIRVAWLGVEQAFFNLERRAPEPGCGPFVLAVSTLHPHKNLDRLLEAFARFRDLRPGYRLVITGLRGFHTQPLEARRKQLGLEDAVEFTGWIPRERLYDLYATADAFIYPSTFEGFGLPVLEALAAGIPSACSQIQPLSGIAGEAALQFDPGNIDAIVSALVRLTADQSLREWLSRAGPERAARYSWTATAKTTLAVLSAAAGTR